MHLLPEWFRLLAPFASLAVGLAFADEGAGGDDDPPDDDDEVDDAEDEDDDLEDLNDDPEDLRRNLRASRRAEREAKKKLKDKDDELQELRSFKAEVEEGERTELEEAQGQVADLQTENAQLKERLREQAITHAIEQEAGRAQFQVPDEDGKIEKDGPAFSFAEPSVARSLILGDNGLFEMLEYDEETGEVDGHVDALKKLAEKTYLLDREEEKSTAPRTPRRAGSRRTDLSPESLEDQPSEEALGVSTQSF